MAAPMKQDKILIQKIRNFAIFSRLCLVLWQAICNNFIPDHDAGVFNPPVLKDVYSETMCDKLVAVVLGGFRRWDGVYFIHITQYGYTYENTLAFFPLYPILIRLIANSVFYPLNLFLNYYSVIVLASVCVNIILFVKTAEILYELGRCVIGNDKIAYKAALLFCMNPASVFMSAPYSECLYSYLTFTGLLNLERKNKLKAALFIGLSFVTRANGALNICYLLYVILKNTLAQLKSLWKAASMKMNVGLTIPWIFFVTTVIPYSMLVVLSLVPFVLYQVYCYKVYCYEDYTVSLPDHVITYGRENGLKLQGDVPISSWCLDHIPVAYTYIQKTYWDQGFLQYWQLKQIPNFLLATPVAVLAVQLAVSYYKHNRYICLTLGLDEAGVAKKGSDPGPYFQLEGVALLPYILHTLTLTVFGWFCIHVQVLTRLLFSSCPVLYWYCADLITMATPQQPKFNKYDVFKSSNATVEVGKNLNSGWNNLLLNQIINIQWQTFKTKLILSYFIAYFLVGTALFSNFLPWT